ncbi:MAG: EamA family transporter [Verrucomicrobia bacterium]|nr:EamA family transporter [Verrucomicrobiota bacterium]
MEERTLGVTVAILAAVLFGASTPFSKLLLGQIDPLLLAGLLYLGSGAGLTLWIGFQRLILKAKNQEAGLRLKDLPWLAGAILAGGVVAPILLMQGLAVTPASSASLLLNMEGVLTALFAWFVFKENFDQRIMLGMAAILLGGVLLSWQSRPELGVPWGAIGIVGACFGWAIDNNLTRKVSAANPAQVAALKGLVAGTTNVLLAFSIGARLPAIPGLTGAALLGFLSYGVSLTCFVLALRHIGTARTGAYFSTAPFIGAILSLALLHEPVSWLFWIAGGLMILGVWLHLTEYHAHLHRHEPLAHDHLHWHDQHHQHAHTATDPPGEPHSHVHRHEELLHSHPHYPDLHHRHKH